MFNIKFWSFSIVVSLQRSNEGNDPNSTHIRRLKKNDTSTLLISILRYQKYRCELGVPHLKLAPVKCIFTSILIFYSF